MLNVMEIILGLIVSALAQIFKKFAGTRGYLNTLFVVFLALTASGGYYLLGHLGYWETTFKILTIAGSFYAFIIKRFESEK